MVFLRSLFKLIGILSVLSLPVSCGQSDRTQIVLEQQASEGLPRAERDAVTNWESLPGAVVATAYKGEEISISSSSELLTAIGSATAGQVLVVEDGAYNLPHRPTLEGDGTSEAPIVLKARNPRQATLIFSQASGLVEGFVALGKNWVIDGFRLTSDCSSSLHSRCEHGIHIKTNADNLRIVNNEIFDFNAAIKGGGSSNIYANNVIIQNNKIYNTSVRNTSNPVTLIDINGGDGWTVAKNQIYDFIKGGGNQISYGAFLKANSSNGLFHSNFVMGTKNITAPGYRIGLSFGGGGNSPIDSPICKDSDCSHLHRKGKMVGNLIVDCSDVGIYVNASSEIQLIHNTLLRTTGIDVRFDTSSATIQGNILVGGAVRTRNGGIILSQDDNLVAAVSTVNSLLDLNTLGDSVNSAEPSPATDICGNTRLSSPKQGAVTGDSELGAECLEALSP